MGLRLPWYDHFLIGGNIATCHVLVEREWILVQTTTYAPSSIIIMTHGNIPSNFFYSLILCPYILEIQMLSIQIGKKKWIYERSFYKWINPLDASIRTQCTHIGIRKFKYEHFPF